MEWISAKDKLPANDGYYLVCRKTEQSSYPNGDMAVCLYETGVWWLGHFTIEVTYWADLPARPISLREKVMFGLSRWNHENDPEKGCPVLNESCHDIGCPYAGTDCELAIIADAYRVLKGEHDV